MSAERHYEGADIITLQHFYIRVLVCVGDRDMRERQTHTDTGMSTLTGQNRVSDLLELELQAAVRHLGIGNLSPLD